MKPRFFTLLLTLCLSAALQPATEAAICAAQAASRGGRPSAEGGRDASDGQLRRFSVFYLEAVLQREKGNADAAYDLLRHALEIIPDAPEALYELARLRLANNADDTTHTTEELLRRAVAAEPGNYYFQKELADYYDARGMADSATARYEAMAAQFRDREILTYNLIDIYRQSGNYEALIKTLEKLELQEGKSEEISMEKIDALRAAGQNEKALEEIGGLMEQYPEDLRYRVMRGGIYYDMGQTQKALDEFKKTLAEEPGNEAANFAMLKYYKDERLDSLFTETAEAIAVNSKFSVRTRGAALAQLMSGGAGGGTDTARVASIFKAVCAQPDADAALLDLYQEFLLMVKSPEDSIAPVWERILKAQPEYSTLRLRLLQHYIQRQDYGKAAALCEEGAQQEPQQVAYYFYGGSAYYSMKDYEHAAGMLYEGTRRISPETSIELASDIYGFLGDVYHSMGKAEEAYQAYDSALVFKDDNIPALNNYAYYLSLERKDLDKAAGMSLRTIKAEPANATYLDTYAWVLFEQGKIEEAHNYIMQALENTSPTEENASIYEHAGDILAVKGDTAEALEMWKKAESLNSASATLKKKIKRKKYIAQ